MEKYLEHKEEIYNLHHGFLSPGKIRVDNFLLEITQEHCHNLKKLEKVVSHDFKFNAVDGFHVTTSGAVHGEYAVTATVICKKSDITPSVLYEDKNTNTNIDDLCVTLSALTGRLVFLEKTLESRPPVLKVDGIASHHFLSSGQVSLKGLERIRDDGLSTAFLNLSYLPMGRDLLAMSAYANCILNVLYEEWCARNNATKYPQANNVRNALSAASDAIKEKLIGIGVDEDSCKDIIARIKIESSPSAIYKIGQFLRGIGITEGVHRDLSEKHIKWINTVRNRLTHTGGLPKDKDIPYERMADI